MNYGIVWGRIKALTKPQQLALKKAAGTRLRDASQEARMAFYCVVNDEYHYDECTQDKLFFALCVDMFVNIYKTPNDEEPKADAGMKFETYLSKLYNDEKATASIKRDITALCSERYAMNGRLQKHMMQFVMMMERDKDFGFLNVKKLTDDLLAWSDPGHGVQRDWGQTIARVRTDKKEPSKEEADTTVNKEIE